MTTEPLRPGDMSSPGTPDTLEDICPDCQGSGRKGEARCPNCEGTGRVLVQVNGE